MEFFLGGTLLQVLRESFSPERITTAKVVQKDKYTAARDMRGSRIYAYVLCVNTRPFGALDKVPRLRALCPVKLIGPTLD